MLPRRYLDEMGHTLVAQLWEGNYFNNAARGIIITNLKQEVRDYVYTLMYTEEYTLTECSAESDSHSSTGGEDGQIDPTF